MANPGDRALARVSFATKEATQESLFLLGCHGLSVYRIDAAQSRMIRGHRAAANQWIVLADRVDPAFPNVSASRTTSQTTVSPAVNRPANKADARGFWSSRWMARLSGLAP